MVQVLVMRVRVPHGLVTMPVRVRFDYWTIVRMLMMPVVDVRMLVLQGLVYMLMFVLLGQMQP